MEKAIILKKQEEVNALTEKIKGAKTVVACDYAGLTVFEFTELRRALRAAGCDIKVYKKEVLCNPSNFSKVIHVFNNFLKANIIT